MHAHTQIIAKELNLSARQVAATLSLIEEGATIPFMARYRKEATGSLDEVVLAAIRDRVGRLPEVCASEERLHSRGGPR